MSTTIYVLLIILVSSVVRGGFGFGNALIAMPLLALALELRIVTPLVAGISTLMAVAMMSRNLRHVDFGSAWRLTLASFAGIPLGLWLLTTEYDAIMKAVLGVITIVFSTASLIKPPSGVLKSKRWTWLFGAAAGVLGGAYNTNGPPVVIYGSLKGWSPETFRATLQSFFLVSGITIVFGHVVGGLWSPQVFRLFVMSVPAMLAGICLGRMLLRGVPPGIFNRCIHAILIVVGFMLLVNALKSLLQS